MHTEEILFAETEDGLVLSGVAIRPTGPRKPHAVVLIHGNTGKFCDYPYITIGRALAERGYLFVAGNTRGHDVAASIWNLMKDGPVAGGSAWEQLEDSPLDVAVWLDAASKEGTERIILMGHSQGAGKIVYSQALKPDARVAGLVLASPDLRGHWPPEMVAQAREMVGAGRGNETLPPLFDAEWYRLSAHNVISRAEVLSHVYHSDKGAPHLAAIRVPVLAMFASQFDVGGEPELAAIRENAKNAARVETCIIEGGDHAYTDREDEVAAAVAGWAESLSVESYL